MKLKDIKKGEYFTLKPIAEPKESQVYIKEEYDRSEKKKCRIERSRSQLRKKGNII